MTRRSVELCILLFGINSIYDRTSQFRPEYFSNSVSILFRFFDINPVGRMQNRFSKDISFLDDQMPITLLEFIQIVLIVVGVTLLVSIINPWLFLVSIPLIWVFVRLRRFYMATGRYIKRIESVQRSPVLSHVTSSLAGLSTIRSQGAAERFSAEFDALQDGHNRAYLTFVIL